MTTENKTNETPEFDENFFLRAYHAINNDAATAFGQNVVRNPATDRIVKVDGFEESDEGLLVSFRLEPVHHTIKSYMADPTGNTPVFVDLEYIHIQAPGDKHTSIDRPVSEFDKFRFRKEYQAWKDGSSQEIEGTPLMQMHGMTVAQAKELELYGVKTIEQLVHMSDSTNVVAGLQNLKRMARSFISERNNNSAHNSEVVQKEQSSEIAALKEQLAQVMQLLKAKTVEETSDETASEEVTQSAYQRRKNK